MVGGKDDDDMLGFPGDTFKDTKTVEVEDPPEDDGDSGMND